MKDNERKNTSSCTVSEGKTMSPIGPMHPSRMATVLLGFSSGVLPLSTFLMHLLPLGHGSFARSLLVACLQSVISPINSRLSQFPRTMPGPPGPLFQLLFCSANKIAAFLLQLLCTFLSTLVAGRDLLVQILNLLSQRTSFPFGLLNDTISVFNE